MTKTYSKNAADLALSLEKSPGVIVPGWGSEPAAAISGPHRAMSGMSVSA